MDDIKQQIKVQGEKVRALKAAEVRLFIFMIFLF